jgi:hypothetical protein
VGQKLRDAVEAAHKGTGKWGSYIDHQGDDESGDVIYSSGGDTMSAPYEIASNGDGVAHTAKLALDSARKVSPRVTYEDCPEDDSDGMEKMYEAALYTRGGLPLVERFVPKKERDQAKDTDFAGKGKSYPILKAVDVTPALQSIGRAGAGNYGPAKLRANIIAIAKRKGFPLPKGLKDAEVKESAAPPPGLIRLVESTAFPEDLVSIRESSGAGVGKFIKLITPGRGATAYYTAEVLKRDGPKVFSAGTPMRIDHPTKAEEAARPEGSVKDWGAVLAEPARWMDSHVSLSTGRDNGPGLYAPIKPFSDHAQTIEEKGPYAGVSIAAWGEPERENGRIVMREGVPLLASLNSADGADMVTRAGAGGLFVTEAARAAITQQQEASMDASELQLLRESVARLSGKETRREAIQEGARILRDVSLPDAAKEYVIETVLKEALPMKDGALDITKYAEVVNAEAHRFGAAIGGQRVVGMGVAAPVQLTEAQRAEQASQAKEEEALYVESWTTLLDGSVKLAEVAVRGRAN